MNIEIRGHADSQGAEEKKVELSIKRAQTVKDYLVSKRVDAKRISCEGFGSSKPLADNSIELSRKKNLRVEFAVIIGWSRLNRIKIISIK
jgi:OOP family OmpA-OmpF porin